MELGNWLNGVALHFMRHTTSNCLSAERKQQGQKWCIICRKEWETVSTMQLEMAFLEELVCELMLEKWNFRNGRRGAGQVQNQCLPSCPCNLSSPYSPQSQGLNPWIQTFTFLENSMLSPACLSRFLLLSLAMSIFWKRIPTLTSLTPYWAWHLSHPTEYWLLVEFYSNQKLTQEVDTFTGTSEEWDPKECSLAHDLRKKIYIEFKD